MFSALRALSCRCLGLSPKSKLLRQPPTSPLVASQPKHHRGKTPLATLTEKHLRTDFVTSIVCAQTVTGNDYGMLLCARV